MTVDRVGTMLWQRAGVYPVPPIHTASAIRMVLLLSIIDPFQVTNRKFAFHLINYVHYL